MLCEKRSLLKGRKGDPKGWIPSAVTTFVATKALPKSLANLAVHLESCPPVKVSKALTLACEEAKLDAGLLDITEIEEEAVSDVSSVESERIKKLADRVAALEAKLNQTQSAVQSTTSTVLHAVSLTCSILALLGGTAYFFRSRR